jgi:hypothetical protein
MNKKPNKEFELDRRSFLAGLFAISLLPDALRELPEEKIDLTDEIWGMIEDNPAEFIVHSGGTIDLEIDIAPITRAEAFEFGEFELRSAEELTGFAEMVHPVMWELQNLYEEYRSEKYDQDIDDFEEDEKIITEFEEKWPEYADEEFTAKWVLQLSNQDFKNLCSKMRKWAASEPNWTSETDYFDVPAGGQEYSLMFFRDYTEREVLDALGIVIVEGEHPGSTYYAAELSIPVEEANARARKAGIPIIFADAKGTW